MAKTKTRKPPRAPKLTARQRAADQNPLYDPATTLSGHRLSDAADAIVNSEFGPKLAALGRQGRSTEIQGNALINRAGDYFSQLATRSGKALDTQAAVAAQLRAGLANVAATAGGATDQAQASVLDRLAADRAQRGAGLEGGGDRAVMDELAAQRANQAANAQGFQSAGELQGSRAAELQAEMAAATQQHGGELHGQLVNRLANDMTKIRGERSDLEAQRGDERVKQLAALRQQGFENLVTTRGLGLKQEQLAADVANQQSQADLAAQRLLSSDRHNRATERNQRSSTRLQGQSLAERQRHNAVLEDLSQLRVNIQQQRADAQKNGKGGKEPASAIKIKRGIQNTFSILDNGTHSEGYLDRVVGVPPDVMQAAKDLQNFGYLQYDTVRTLKQLGVKIPKRWQPPRVDRTAPH